MTRRFFSANRLPAPHAMKCLKPILLLTGLCLAGGFFCACTSYVRVQRPAGLQPPLSPVMVLPFRRLVDPEMEERSIPCRQCPEERMAGGVRPQALDFMTDVLRRRLETAAGWEVLAATSPNGLPPVSGPTAQVFARNGAMILAMAREKEARTVLWGTVYRFIERTGKDYGVQSPASVAFDLVLFSVADEKIVWKAEFEETQQSLLENVFSLQMFIRRRARWVTAEEMAATALKDTIKRLPNVDDYSGRGFEKR